MRRRYVWVFPTNEVPPSHEVANCASHDDETVIANSSILLPGALRSRERNRRLLSIIPVLYISFSCLNWRMVLASSHNVSSIAAIKRCMSSISVCVCACACVRVRVWVCVCVCLCVCVCVCLCLCLCVCVGVGVWVCGCVGVGGWVWPAC